MLSQMKVLTIFFGCIVPNACLATVGSDPSVNYVVTPGTTTLGDSVGRVTSPGGGGCSGSLLSSGQHVLTAGHCAGLEGASGTSGTVSWNTPNGIVTQSGVYQVHTMMQSFIDHIGPTGTYLGVNQGVDIAVLELTSPAPASVTRNDILRDDSGVEYGTLALRIGYGEFGLRKYRCYKSS